MKKNRPEERNMRIVKVNKDSIANILSDLLKRSPTNYGDFQDKVDAIIKNVRDNGDKLSLIIQHSLIKQRSMQTIF